jgi:hypothetical protein
MNGHLSLWPQGIVRGEAWYYEEPRGISIYTRKGPVCLITWRKLRASLARKDRRADAATREETMNG